MSWSLSPLSWTVTTARTMECLHTCSCYPPDEELRRRHVLSLQSYLPRFHSYCVKQVTFSSTADQQISINETSICTISSSTPSHLRHGWRSNCLPQNLPLVLWLGSAPAFLPLFCWTYPQLLLQLLTLSKSHCHRSSWRWGGVGGSSAVCNHSVCCGSDRCCSASGPAGGEWSAGLCETPVCRWSIAPLIRQQNG